MRFLWLVAAGLVLAAQNGPAFDVVSIKANNSGDPIRSRSTPNRFAATNITVQQLIQSAYGMRDFEIFGGPGWMKSDRFDVDARADTASDAQNRQLMLRRLLADRFGLRVHSEKRLLPAYQLVVARGGPKTIDRSSSKDAPGADDKLPPPGGLRAMNGAVYASQMSVGALARVLTTIVRRPVIDETSLSGSYDVKIEWSPAEGESGPFGPVTAEGAREFPDRPSLFTALEEQLGLKLQPLKEPIEVLVVDSVQKPSEN